MKQEENHWKLTDMIFFRISQSRMEWRFIQATVGADAKGTINAETYDPEAGNYSIFSWSEGNGDRTGNY